jgi:hypothetical protein
MGFVAALPPALAVGARGRGLTLGVHHAAVQLPLCWPRLEPVPIDPVITDLVPCVGWTETGPGPFVIGSSTSFPRFLRAHWLCAVIRRSVGRICIFAKFICLTKKGGLKLVGISGAPRCWFVPS